MTERVSLDLQFRKLAALVPKRPWGFSHVGKRDVESGGSSADQDCVDLVSRASPFTKKEGSGTAPLLELFFSQEILGNMNMQILWLRHDRGM